MGKDTTIQWCDSTVNPVMGCEGCELARPDTPDGNSCYAWFQTNVHSKSSSSGWPNHFFQPKLFRGRMAAAARWSSLARTNRPDNPWLGDRPRLIFVSDMGDALSKTECIGPDGEVLHEVPFSFLKEEIIDVVSSDKGRQHLWLWLTKRPRRMTQFSEWLQAPWPRNLWAGTSVTDRRTLNRVIDLQKVGDAETVRFISAEPLWEEISLSRHLATGKIAWVIVGGESKQQRADVRPAKTFDLTWARRLRDECRVSKVPMFVKQLGGIVYEDGTPSALADDSGHGGAWDGWSGEGKRVRPPVVGDIS